MKSHPLFAVIALLSTLVISTNVNAATVLSSSFGSTPASVNLDGFDDWGYVSGGLFGSSSTSGTVYTYDGSGVTNRKSTGVYGAATLTENGTLGTKADAQFDVTFTTGTAPAPVSGTSLSFGGGFGDHRVENLFTYSFQDVGAGTHTIDMYFASSDKFNGTMEFTTNILASDGNVVDHVSSGVWPGSAFTWKYTLEFQTTDANADITVFWDNTVSPDGGSASAGLWTATVVPIPEPSGALLGGLGALMLLRRRRG